MKDYAVPLFVVLLSVPIIGGVWEIKHFFEGLDRMAGAPNPKMLQKLSQLDADLASGAIRVNPPEKLKIIRASVQSWRSRMQQDEHAMAPFIDVIDGDLKFSLFVFAMQLSVALGLPVWVRWQRSRAVRQRVTGRP